MSGDGKEVASSIARRFLDLDPEAWHGVRAQMEKESLELGVTYQPEGKPVEVTDLVMVPVVFDGADLAAIRDVVEVLSKIMARAPGWRMESEAVRETLPLSAGEEEWMRDCALSPRWQDHAIVGRWDLNVDQTGPNGPRILLFEGNGNAVGGINYTPAAEIVVHNAVKRVFAETGGRLPPVRRTGDIHEAFFRMLNDHARRLGRTLKTFVILEDRTWTAGITEAPYIVNAVRKRGVFAKLSDPRELRVWRGEVCLGNRPVDVLYRNIEIRDLLDIEAADGRIEALRLAFRRNQVISSLAGEFDHKSLLETMTLPEVERGLSSEWREVVRTVVPWTRLMREVKTADPAGRQVDLPSYVRRHKDALVLKPNRECGGDGVTIGTYRDQSAWERAVHRAIRHKSEWVVQQAIKPAEIPVPAKWRGKIRLGARYTNAGVITIPGGPYVLGRSSAMPVVNVSRGGGIVAVLRTA
ncbi:MAG: hypothetical protein HY897_08585 [Deltaproteobacteria bacterium]|nr:hypothetical protein [Deltaproteobacteria bacterium]